MGVAARMRQPLFTDECIRGISPVCGKKELMGEGRFVRNGGAMEEQKKRTVEVLIPTYRPGKELEKLLVMLEKQTYPLERIRIVNTERSLWDMGIEERHPRILVSHISRKAFDHGGTRGAMAAESTCDLMLFMTQDAVPRDKFLVEELVRAMEQPGVKAAYARQLPASDCREGEKFTRVFNYPEKSRVKTKEDFDTLGIKTFFCSNVCAMYERKTYEELGGFVQRTIFNEDMIYASKLIRAGYGIAYAAEAKVIHSHNYSCMQQFHRNFDLGVSQAQYKEAFLGVRSEGEGLRLVKRTAAHLISMHKWWMVPELFLQSAFKYAGYFLGKHYQCLPKKIILQCTMSKNYW